MKPVSFPALFGLAIALSGCVNQAIWYKPNVSPSLNVSDRTDCEVEAAQTVPSNTQVRTTPSFTTPTYVDCYGGFCSVTGGDQVGGKTYSVDTNKDLRDRVMRQCMAKRGWQVVTLPYCGAGEQKAYKADPARYRVPGKLSAGACVIYDTTIKDFVIFAP